jgi:hypothetical protein
MGVGGYNQGVEKFSFLWADISFFVLIDCLELFLILLLFLMRFFRLPCRGLLLAVPMWFPRLELLLMFAFF